MAGSSGSGWWRARPSSSCCFASSAACRAESRRSTGAAAPAWDRTAAVSQPPRSRTALGTRTSTGAPGRAPPFPAPRMGPKRAQSLVVFAALRFLRRRFGLPCNTSYLQIIVRHPWGMRGSCLEDDRDRRGGTSALGNPLLLLLRDRRRSARYTGSVFSGRTGEQRILRLGDCRPTDGSRSEKGAGSHRNLLG